MAPSKRTVKLLMKFASPILSFLLLSLFVFVLDTSVTFYKIYEKDRDEVNSKLAEILSNRFKSEFLVVTEPETLNETELDYFTAKLFKLNSKYQELEDRYKNATVENEMHKYTISNLISTYNDSVADFRKVVDQVTNEQIKVDLLKAQVEQCNTTIKSKMVPMSQYQTLIDEINEVRQSDNNNKMKIGYLERRNNLLEANSAETDNIRKINKQFEAEIQELKRAADDAKNSALQYARMYNNLISKTETEELRKMINQNEVEKQALKTKLNDALRRASDCTRDLSYRDAIQDKTDVLSNTIGELNRTNDELRKTNDELRKTNIELHKTNGELGNKNNELLKTNNEICNKNDELQQEIKDLNNKLDNEKETASYYERLYEELRCRYYGR